MADWALYDAFSAIKCNCSYKWAYVSTHYMTEKSAQSVILTHVLRTLLEKFVIDDDMIPYLSSK